MENEQNIQHQQNKSWYDKYYKIILLIPIILLVIALVYLVKFQNENGDIIRKDVSLTGGTSITVFDSSVSVEDLQNSLLQQFPDLSIRTLSDFQTGAQTGFILETKAHVDEIRPALEDYLKYSLTQENSSIEFSGSTLSQGFYQQLRLAVILAFLFMAIVVFIIFRTLVPSAAVVFAAFADIIMTLVVVNYLGIELSMAGVVTFLMLIGYSVDTDILLTTRVLQRGEQSINKSIYGAFKTGIMMTLTAIVAVGIALFFIRNSSEVLSQMFTILLIGLFFDILNTWVTNASMLKWYAEKKEARK